jgi:mono/diheme cytochrome c family protein
MIRRAVALAVIPLVLGVTIERTSGEAAGQTAETSTVWNGVYTVEQATRGRDEYGTYCATCHGETLTGSSAGPPLVGVAFLRAWNGRSVYDLSTFMAMEMPFDSPGSLAKPTYRDITAFVLQTNRFPAGDRELPEDDVGLKRLLIRDSRH